MSQAALTSESSVLDAVQFIEEHRKTIAPVVDKNGFLIGAVTDGDIRRAILQNVAMNSPIIKVMNKRPFTAHEHESSDSIFLKLREHNLEALPLVDNDGKFVKIVHFSDLGKIETNEILTESGFEVAVILAGGEGRRLRPLTNDIPKPMVDVGGIPLIERQVRKIAAQGIKEIYIAIKYLGHMIQGHFGSGEKFGVNIHYLSEEKKLGTAGALSLITKKFTKPVLVMNGDVLTTTNYKNLLDFHLDNDSLVTVTAVEHIVDIPFGVIESDGPKVTRLKEKPSERFLCSAGIYSLSPEAIAKVPFNEFFNMTDHIEVCLSSDKKVTVFPLHEYWSDIGTLKELKKARAEINKIGNYDVFKN